MLHVVSQGERRLFPPLSGELDEGRLLVLACKELVLGCMEDLELFSLFSFVSHAFFIFSDFRSFFGDFTFIGFRSFPYGLA